MNAGGFNTSPIRILTYLFSFKIGLTHFDKK